MEEIGTDALPEELSLPSAPTGTRTKKRQKGGHTTRPSCSGDKKGREKGRLQDRTKNHSILFKELVFSSRRICNQNALSTIYYFHPETVARHNASAKIPHRAKKIQRAAWAGSVGRRERESEVALTLSYSSSRNSPCRSR